MTWTGVCWCSGVCVCVCWWVDVCMYVCVQAYLTQSKAPVALQTESVLLK